ncbi:MAG: AEC family transporter, partial [Coprobacillaceae bacterium]
MGEVLLKALGFILVIIIGFSAKKWKILKKEDGNVLATIIMNITLPCALLSSVGDLQLNGAMLILLVLGVVFNIVMVIVGYYASSKYSPIRRAAYMINCSGYNIGNFTLPFAQSFFPGMGVAYLCMFDVGNAIMCLGGTFAIALGVCNNDEKISASSVAKRLVSSIPFMVYVVIFILSVFQISIPNSVLSVTNYIGNAN